MEILVSDSPVKAGPNGKAYPEPKKVSLATIHDDFARLGKAEFFAGVVFDELERMRDRPALTALDVGCGGGFHHRPDLQAQIGSRTSRFLGVEPDPDAHVQAEFAAIYRSTLEGADLPPNSVDLAYAVMVLEHVADAESFFAKLDSVLKPGGVFWGFTVDRRHWFAWSSQWMQRLGLKDRYLDLLHGKRGEERYENFPTHYRCNSPRALQELAGQHLKVETWSLHKHGQLDFYLPRWTWPVAHLVDRVSMMAGLPGSVLAVRVSKPLRG